MLDYRIRTLDDADTPAADALFRGTLHHRPTSVEQLDDLKPSYAPGRALGAFDGDELAGTALSYPSALAVPGGATLRMAAVSRIGVRADHTRRGILTALQRHQFQDLVERGDVVATLRASEATIYGRFGYGVAERTRSITVDPLTARIRPDLAPVGRIRLVDDAEAKTLLPTLYERIGLHRPGMMARPAELWNIWWIRAAKVDGLSRTAVHTDAEGVADGFVTYRASKAAGFRAELTVDDLHGATPTAIRELWRFLLGVDLIAAIKAGSQPVDDSLEWLLVDRRAVRVDAVQDSTWLRLLDVPTALAARTYGDADSVVIELTDDLLPANAGRYRIGSDGARRTDDPAALSMGVAALGALYLGDVAPSTLAEAGLITTPGGPDPAALRRADRLFRTPVLPHCGSFF
ncbi:putative acetyltransferase [Actinoalloteichus hoggarensis]|uniref:Enhanced intracellular survival protein n=1 Tax=Actinoalloteichus hoggarensis TaxID=1470176 RepID=A0A221W2R7_9PSEU|nr:GNAT family N-acetyltransferase [Actinoalloteichus hoggarensis]ASO20088.1 Enhanced intracellular survival protein [Actinoalloteichus hoggarensis]MBB5919200.1 putative acetyltransferase [Actinoalloteichus hoggarensis]